MSLVLVVNSGSSSLKYALVDPDTGRRPASGLVERIGEDGSRIVHRVVDADGTATDTELVEPVADHDAAFSLMRKAFDLAGPSGPDAQPDVVGHRVVHGGDLFAAPVLVTPDVIAAVEECVPLAPLHNPANLLGIAAAERDHPDLPQVAVFDTAFHQTLAPAAFTYAVDRDVARAHRLRRYGFHGTSHAYVSRRATQWLAAQRDADPATARVVTLHLGNGASACAVRGGRSVDTSMGLTPLEGLVMGTRSGDIDPAAISYLCRNAGLDVDGVDDLLNRRSGLLGLCGDNDMRRVLERADSGDGDAQLAFDVYVHRVRHYVGAYLAALGGLDALVFTAGVGENSARVRAAVCDGWSMPSIAVDEARNAAPAFDDGIADVSAAGSGVAVLVVRTDEEREIAAQAARVAAS